MQVKWNEFLHALGVTVIGDSPGKRQHCPLHPGTAPTLSIYQSAVTGAWHFDCNDNRCGFSGDAAALVGRVRSCSLEAAVGLFRPGNQFAHTLVADLGDYQLDLYLQDQSSQVRLATYLNSASQALRQPGGELLRRKMADHGAIQYGPIGDCELPRSLGMVTQGDLPKALKILDTCKYYRTSYFALYPHTFDGRVMYVTTQDFGDTALRTRDIPIVRDDIGIFMEENLKPSQEEVYVTTSELVACTLYKKFKAMSSNLPPIVAMRNFPFPDTYRQLKRVTILSLPDEPLTLETALRLYVTPAVTHTEAEIKVRVWDIKGTRAENTSPNLFTRNYDNPHQKGQRSLGCWLVNTIRELVEDSNAEAVYCAFDKIPFTDAHKQQLLFEAEKLGASDAVFQVLAAVGSQYRTSFRLGNGREVRITPGGLLAKACNGHDSTLCNIPLAVEHCVYTRGGEVRYACHFRADGTQTVKVQLAPQDFATAKSLQATVIGALARQNMTTYVAFYDVPHYRWDDIFRRLAQGKPIRQEITRLGADDTGYVHLPHVTLNLTAQAAEPGLCDYTLPPAVVGAYNGLRYNPDADALGTMRSFLQQAPAYPGAAGLMAGICQFVYQLLVDVLGVRDGAVPGPRHLLYVADEYTTWAPVLQQLTQIFSGSNQLLQIPANRSLQYLDTLSPMGALPCVCALPAIPYKRLPALVSDSAVSITALADSNAAMVLTGDSRVSFVTLPCSTEFAATQTHSEDIYTLQAALPDFLLRLLSEPVDPLSAMELRNAPIPAQAAYEYMCKFLGIQACATALGQVKQYYTVAGINNAYAFMHALADLLELRTPRLHTKLKTLNGAPNAVTLTQRDAPTIFVTENRVYIDRGIVHTVNQNTSRPGLFRTASLTAEFERYGYALTCPEHVQIDAERFWILDRTVWDKYVMREPLLLLKRLEPGNILELPRLTA